LPIRASTTTDGIGPCDLVIVATKPSTSRPEIRFLVLREVGPAHPAVVAACRADEQGFEIGRAGPTSAEWIVV
jgi:hypothetical protein